MKTFTATADEVASLRLLLSSITATRADAASQGVANTSELSAEIIDLLQYVLDEFSEGRSVTVASSEIRLTTQEAADLAGVSRPTLIKLLEEYDIPFDTVGRHRRIRFDDFRVLQSRYLDTQRLRRKATIQLSQESGEYAADPSDNPLVRRK